MSDVVKFYPADAYKNPDNVLEQAVGDFKDVLIAGYTPDGDISIRLSEGLDNGPQMLWLLEMVRKCLIDGMSDG